MRARTLIGPQDPRGGRSRVNKALTEVFALSGQVERAIDMGEMLLARLGTGPVPHPGGGPAPGDRAGGVSRARAGRRRRRASRWPAESPGVEAARVDACAARWPQGRGDLHWGGSSWRGPPWRQTDD